MLLNFEALASLGETRDLELAQPVLLGGQGLWAAVVSRGRCAAGDTGSLLIQPGMLVLARTALSLAPQQGDCHVLAARLCGSAAAELAAALPADLFPARGESCPRAAELLEELARAEAGPSRAQSPLVFALLCELAGADAAETPLPPLVAEAVACIRQNYAGLYGVEELSEQLGVSKSHLVRAFHAAMGVSPGKYLTTVRIEAAKRLLLHREYSLEIVASLCGFSGANYLCRVFKKETGHTPTAWRASAMQGLSGLSAAEAAREQALYV